MSAPRSSAPLDALREAAQRAVDRASVRQVAAELNLSHTGLRRFLNGGDVRRSTLFRLRDWYVRQDPADAETSADTARAAVAVLLHNVREDAWPRARHALLLELRRLHRVHAAEVPEWIEQAIAEEEEEEP